MYRQVAVAGELYVPPERQRTPHSRAPAAQISARAATPAPRALPYTGLHMAVGHPSTVIVSDLLSDLLPSHLDAPLMILGGTGDYPAITLTDADFEEVEDLTPQPAAETAATTPDTDDLAITRPVHYLGDLTSSADVAIS